MKRITGLTEDQATTVAAAVITHRAVRSARVERDRTATVTSTSFYVEVDTFPGEETASHSQ